MDAIVSSDANYLSHSSGVSADLWRAAGRDFIATQAGERKHEWAEEYLPEDPDFRGLFLVMTGNAPAPVWEAAAGRD